MAVAVAVAGAAAEAAVVMPVMAAEAVKTKPSKAYLTNKEVEPKSSTSLFIYEILNENINRDKTLFLQRQGYCSSVSR